MPTIPRAQFDVARKYLINVDDAARAAAAAGCPWWLLCAVLDKESDGRNIFGHDRGGAFSDPGGKIIEVTEARWKEFRQLVLVEKQTSNGVGPMQLTWPGFFSDMEKQDLKPWVVYDNMLYGARLLASYWHAASGTTDDRVQEVGRRYNGSSSYGVDLVKVARTWRARIAVGAFTDAKLTHFADLPIDTAYKARSLWQGACVAVDPRDGQEYLFQLQAQPYKGDVEHTWIHRYRLAGNQLTYLDSQRGLKFGHVQTLHVRISKHGNPRIWLGVETYLKGVSAGSKVWRIVYRPGDITRARDSHELIYTGPGRVAPISSPAGWIVLRRPAGDHETYEWHLETELRKHRSTTTRPKPVRTVTADRSDGTYQSSCASDDTIYRLNGATDDASVLSQFTVDGRIGRLDITAATSPAAGKVTSEEPEAVFIRAGQLTVGKRFNSVRRRVVAYFTVAS